MTSVVCLVIAGVIEYEEVITSIAEMTNQTQVEGSVEVAKESTPKSANGETGVAGNKHNSKRTNHSTKGVGIAVTGVERDERAHEKDKTREKEKEKDRETPSQTTKASRRTTSLLNLFMSNSQGRLNDRKKN